MATKGTFDTLIREVDRREAGGMLLRHAGAASSHFPAVAILLRRGANFATQDIDGSSPLHVACNTAQVGVMELLVRKCVAVDAVNIYGDTPLHLATKSPHTLQV